MDLALMDSRDRSGLFSFPPSPFHSFPLSLSLFSPHPNLLSLSPSIPSFFSISPSSRAATYSPLSIHPTVHFQLFHSTRRYRRSDEKDPTSPRIRLPIDSLIHRLSAFCAHLNISIASFGRRAHSSHRATTLFRIIWVAPSCRASSFPFPITS